MKLFYAEQRDSQNLPQFFYGFARKRERDAFCREQGMRATTADYMRAFLGWGYLRKQDANLLDVAREQFGDRVHGCWEVQR